MNKDVSRALEHPNTLKLEYKRKSHSNTSTGAIRPELGAVEQIPRVHSSRGT